MGNLWSPNSRPDPPQEALVGSYKTPEEASTGLRA
ncbi:hypothetical protein CASFOL_004580 [Castilleja foliolosa]|uniref:Ribulose-1,5-bisphosphate carboxylase/oxygenase large subunit n=1 Tax=Castilleja foliolosa TaxID=1961234 RepID=A0ABD3EAW6_9LAMI